VVVQRTYFQNIDGNTALTFHWQADPPAGFSKCLKISAWGTLSRSHNIGISDSSLFTSNTLTFIQNLNLQYGSVRHDINLYIIYDRSITQYAAASAPPTSATMLTWGIKNRHSLTRNWALYYDIRQNLTTGISQSLIVAPAVLNARLERSFGMKQQLSCSLTGLNLLNANAGVTQNVTLDPTTITQNRANFVGRTYMLSFKLKFERYR
jgi:hypothetical protein